jgi:hypothetical protein
MEKRVIRLKIVAAHYVYNSKLVLLKVNLILRHAHAKMSKNAQQTFVGMALHVILSITAVVNSAKPNIIASKDLHSIKILANVSPYCLVLKIFAGMALHVIH